MSKGLVKCFRALLLVQKKNTAVLPASRNIFNRVKPWHVREKIKKDTRWTAPLLEWREQKAQFEDLEPAPLHVVTKVKILKGRPYWEKAICEKIGLGKTVPLYKKVVVKNTHHHNSQLEKIKHLVEIQPIKFPFGLPEAPDDYNHCFIKDNGEFIVRKKIGDETMKTADEDLNIVYTKPVSKWKMSKETLAKHVQRKLDQKEINMEYFRSKNVYKYNQDGKEYRYFGDKAWHGKGREWF